MELSFLVVMKSISFLLYILSSCCRKTGCRLSVPQSVGRVHDHFSVVVRTYRGMVLVLLVVVVVSFRLCPLYIRTDLLQYGDGSSNTGSWFFFFQWHTCHSSFLHSLRPHTACARNSIASDPFVACIADSLLSVVFFFVVVICLSTSS